MARLWVWANAAGVGTERVNTHPICVLYASKVASLTGAAPISDPDTFAAAYRACTLGADGADVDAIAAGGAVH